MTATTLLGALVLALAARSSSSFLVPPSTTAASAASRATITRVERHRGQHYCSDTGTSCRASALRDRVPDRTPTTARIAGGCGSSSSQYRRSHRHTRHTAVGALMMAKKKGGGGGKKKKQAATRSRINSGAEGGVAVADAPGSSSTIAFADATPALATAIPDSTTATEPAGAEELDANIDTITDNDNNGVIQNRVADAKPVTASTQTPPMSAGTGFGKPVAQPKAPPKQAPKAAGNTVAGQSARQQAGAGQGGGGAGAGAAGGGLPPKVVPGQDAAVPGLAATGSGDHQRVSEGVERIVTILSVIRVTRVELW